MQKLAGIITESEYKAKMNEINPEEDTITDQFGESIDIGDTVIRFRLDTEYWIYVKANNKEEAINKAKENIQDFKPKSSTIFNIKSEEDLKTLKRDMEGGNLDSIYQSPYDTGNDE